MTRYHFFLAQNDVSAARCLALASPCASLKQGRAGRLPELAGTSPPALHKNMLMWGTLLAEIWSRSHDTDRLGITSGIARRNLEQICAWPAALPAALEHPRAASGSLRQPQAASGNLRRPQAGPGGCRLWHRIFAQLSAFFAKSWRKISVQLFNFFSKSWRKIFAQLFAIFREKLGAKTPLKSSFF